MLSAVLTIAAVAALAFGLLKILSEFLPYMVEWFNYAFTEVYGVFDYLPGWLLPFAFVAVILALVGWGVKLL